MRIRHLRIRTGTDRGPFGVDIPFEDGLVVLRAENSMGKSTCLKAILVALGLEAVLTASRDDLPLPPVLKEDVHTGDGHARVIESEVLVEVENRSGERIVARRTIRGSRDPGLIEVTRGAALSKPGSYSSEEYFVGRPGDTTRELGFLRFLMSFLGWEVPVVRTFRGDDRPLYLQCLVPYFFVEQSRGWSSLEPPIPTRFGIKEMHKRAVEYLLDLDAIRIASRRLEIEEAEQRVQREWNAVIGGIKAIARSVGGVAQRIPAHPIADWPPQIPPTLLMPIGDEWISLDERRSELRASLSQVIEDEIPRVSEIVSTAEAELARAQDSMNDRQALLARVLEVHKAEIDDVTRSEERLRKLEDDVQRNKDARIMLNLGGAVASSVGEHRCPTCHQGIVDSLTPLADGQEVMSIDDNIAFLEEQRRTFRAVLSNQSAVAEARDQQVIALREQIFDLRGQVRSLKETLVSDGRVPSIAAVRKRVKLQEELDQLGRASDEFATGNGDLGKLSGQWRDLQVSKQQLPREDASTKDREKIARWSELLREQLQEYDFRSLEIQDISVSADTYRPQHEGFDLPTNISASDFIRVIWAYLTGMREVGLAFETNHPGLLIFDEPKQQSAKDLSFEQLLKHAACAKDYGHQVIFATSEREERLVRMLESIPHSYHPFQGYMIRPIPDA